jgi:hypothetical protein
VPSLRGKRPASTSSSAIPASSRPSPMAIEVRESAHPLSDDVLLGVESRLGITFPTDYRSFLLRHNGGVPSPEWFRLPVRDEWLAA